jgi:hypothetical protein
MSNVDALSRTTRLYIALLAGATVGLLIVLAVWDPTHVSGTQWLYSILLGIAIVVAQRYPVHLSAKTKVYVDTTFMTAAALMLPPPLALLTAAAPTAIHEIRQRISWEQGIFNLAQTSFYMLAGSFVAHAVSGSADEIAMASGRDVVAMLAGVSVMHLANTAAVAAVVALQVSKRPREVWRESILIDLPEHTVLVANGVLLALVTANYPWLLPLFVGPLVLIYLSLVRRTELRQASQSIIDAIGDLSDSLGGEAPGHSRRVAELTRLLALQLELPAPEVNAAVRAARLFGFGTLGESGAQAAMISELAPKRLLPEASPRQFETLGGIRYARKRRDGREAPNQLSHEATPLQARLIAVADAFERLTASRDTNEVLDELQAVAMLESASGRDWDPRVIDALSRVVIDGTFNGASAAD